MPETCTYKIGDINISLIPDLAEGAYDSAHSFEGFKVQEPAGISLRIHFDNVGESEEMERVIFDSGLGWQQYQVRDRIAIRIKSTLRDPRLIGFFEKNFLTGDIFVGLSEIEPGRYIFPLGFPLGEVFIANLLGTGLGVMLHSCGVIYQGAGLIFAGTGGVGKSTTARLWQNQPGARVINDDRVILRKIKGQYRMYGTPWHGTGGMCLAEDAPLKHIFVLKHAKLNQVTHLEPTRAVTALLARSFSPFWDADGLKFTLQFLTDLCGDVPCEELGFLPDLSAVDFVKSL